MKQIAGLLVLAACGKDAAKAPDPAPPPPAAPRAPADARAIDAPVAIDAAPDPDPNRRGKRTGLTAGEKPEVATEDLVRALAVGNVKLDTLIDPKRGVVMRLDVPGAGDKPVPGGVVDKHLCGAAAIKDTQAYLKRMLDAEVRGHSDKPGESAHVFECTNKFIASPDPEFGTTDYYSGPERFTPDKGHPMTYAQCTSPHIMEWDEA